MDPNEDLKLNPFIINIPGIISTNYLDTLISTKFNTDSINSIRERIEKLSKEISFVTKNNGNSNDSLFSQSKSFIMMSDALSKETILNLGYNSFQKVVLGCFECVNSKINSMSLKVENKVEYSEFSKRLSVIENTVLDINRRNDSQFKEIYDVLRELKDENDVLKNKIEILSNTVRSLDKDMYKYIDDIIAQQDDSPSIQKLKDVCLLLKEQQDNIETRLNDIVHVEEQNNLSNDETKEDSDSEEEIIEYFNNSETQNI